MIEPIIHGLSNEAYHHEAPYSEYLSSSQLKAYLKSPRYFKHQLDNPTDEKSDALRFGSLFHDLMASYAVHYDDEASALRQWEQGIAIFDPPVNKSTNKPYGATSNPYKEAYAAFLQANEGRMIVSIEECDLTYNMANSLLRDSGATSEQVRKLLKWGKPEVSHFIEYEGLKFKFRPDLMTKWHEIVDWKTVVTDDLSERSINSIIANYGYDVSAAMYMFFYHQIYGVWPTFYWCFVSKKPPYDAVMCDTREWTYTYDPATEIVMPQVGAIKFHKVLDLHISCTRSGKWPGAETYIPKGFKGRRIMTPKPPVWEINNAANLLEQI